MSHIGLIKIVTFTLCMLLSGCASFQWPWDRYSERPSYRYFDDPRCAGYGAVNAWATISSEDQAEEIASHDLDVYHIELLSWANFRTDLETTRTQYKKLVKECRKRKVVLFVSVFNDNSHLGKYGNTPWSPSVTYLHSALDIVLNEGNKGVIVQPVGETQTSNGKRFENEAVIRLAQAGFRTCYNRGSRPNGPPNGWNYAAYHPTSTSSRIGSGVVDVTDTGNILMQLGGYSSFHPNSIVTYGNQVLNGWHRPLILYGFLHTSIDKAALEALESVHQK